MWEALHRAGVEKGLLGQILWVARAGGRVTGLSRKVGEWEELGREEEAAGRQVGDSGISEVKARKREGQREQQ